MQVYTPEAGKMFPKEGKVLSCARTTKDLRATYAMTIASALRWELGDTHRATKTIMIWTGAKERTAKNWLAGEHGPAGEHLLALVAKSDAVFTACLDLAGRPLPIPTWTLITARDALDRFLRSAKLQ
jgi:hypothetical protein